MHLSAKYTIYTILDNLHVLYYTVLKYWNTKVTL